MINPTLKQIRAFVAVAQMRSFARAAVTLNLSQPALSETINQFEQTVQSRLFDRTTRSLRLTPVGEYLLPRAESLVAEIGRTFADLREITDLKRGEVIVGSLTSITCRFLPKVIAEFRAQFPNVTIKVKDDNAFGLLRRLLAAEVDFAIVSNHDETGRVAFRPLFRDPFRLIAYHGHPLAGRAQVSWRELLDHTFIGYDKEAGNRFVIEGALDRAGIRLDPAMELSQLGTLIGIVEAGFGVAALPSMAVPLSDRISHCALVDPLVTREIGIMSIAGRSLTPPAQKFAELVVKLSSKDSFRDFPSIEICADA